MRIIDTKAQMKEQVRLLKQEGQTIGFVPTMGYLHSGHVSLIERARQENDKVIVSIFVNPLQFGPQEDFEKYPRDFEADAEKCRAAGVDIIFCPKAQEMYPQRPLAYVDIEALGDGLCGAKRSGHFRGVCTVVAKLFHIVSADRAYFGQKDFQQLAILRQMALDLDFETEIIACPIVRGEDNLALSSRNKYLSAEQRQSALLLSKSLSLAAKAVLGGEKNSEKLIKLIDDILQRDPLIQIDYIEVVDGQSLQAAPEIIPGCVIAVAAFVGTTRLIDNIEL